MNLKLLGLWLLGGLIVSIISSRIKKEDFDSLMHRIFFVELIGVIVFLLVYG